MSNRSRWACLLLGAVASVVGLSSAAPPAAADPDKALAEAQLKLAGDALQVLDKLSREGRMGKADKEAALWGRRRIEALRATGAGKGELVAALEDYREAKERSVQLAEQAFRAARATQLDLLDAKYEAIEAEIWLNREKAR